MTWPGGCHFGRSRRRYQRLSTSVAAPPITAVAAAAAPVARNDLDDMTGSCPAPAGPTRGRGSSRYMAVCPLRHRLRRSWHRTISAMNPLSGVLGEAWKLYRAFAAHLLAIAFVIYIFAAVISAALTGLLGFFGTLLASIVGIIAAFLVQAALVKAVQDIRDGRVDLSFRRDRVGGDPVRRPGSRRVDPGRLRDRDRATAPHRPGPVPADHLGRDRAGHRHRPVRGAGVLRVQQEPGSRQWLERLRHAGAGVPDPDRRGNRARPDPRRATGPASQRDQQRRRRNARGPVPRARGHAHLLPALGGSRRPAAGRPRRRP